MSVSVPICTSSDLAGELRGVFRKAGFEERALLRRYEIADPPAADSPATMRLQPLTSSEHPLDVLSVLFLLGKPQPRAKVDGALGGSCSEILAAAGLAGVDGAALVPRALLAAHGPVLVASDLYPVSESAAHPETFLAVPEANAEDHVLTINPVARHLLHLTRPEPVSSLLDLCAGNGIQGIAAAKRAGRVVLTDLNSRAIEFARFNATLNGADNVDCRRGDGFAPVRGERFEQIVCNPPFVLAPSRRLIATSNDRELDGFCRELVREAPAFLEDGGCFQMVFEWAEVEGQGPTERVASWCEGLSCDAWLLMANVQRPATYATSRALEMRRVTGAETPVIEEWLEHYVRHRVVAIHGGALLLRKCASRTGWFRVDQLSAAPAGSAGGEVSAALRRFDRLDAAGEMNDLHLELDPRTRLQQEAERSNGAWRPTTARLQISQGLPRVQDVEPDMAEFLVHFDGRISVREHLEALAARLGQPVDRIREACERVIRRMIERGFLDFGSP